MPHFTQSIDNTTNRLPIKQIHDSPMAKSTQDKPHSSQAGGQMYENKTTQLDTKSEQNRPLWLAQMADLITDIDELLEVLKLEKLRSTLYVPDKFQLRVPRSFVAKMQTGDPNDPLLLQVLPKRIETQTVAGYSIDPLAETDQNPIRGLLHKYRSRVLVTVTGACAIHCRYCFRQHFDYQTHISTTNQLEQMQAYILEHPEIDEVILSGGDPLSLSHRRLDRWLEAIESLEQINTIRIHSRLPVVIPDRLDTTLIERLQRSRCQIVMVIHTNHASEIDNHTVNLLKSTRASGVTLLNQTVLLAGINDTVVDMVALNKRLFEADVLPYYLHILDKVVGSAHFNVTKQSAIALYWEMLATLPGYLVPKLVEELPHEPFKTPVNLYANHAKVT